MLAFSIDYYGIFFRATQSVELFCTYDPEIADAWYRLTNGTYNQNDIDLLNHEYFESKFESFYKTDYRTAHNKTEESGRIWDPYKENN